MFKIDYTIKTYERIDPSSYTDTDEPIDEIVTIDGVNVDAYRRFTELGNEDTSIEYTCCEASANLDDALKIAKAADWIVDEMNDDYIVAHTEAEMLNEEEYDLEIHRGQMRKKAWTTLQRTFNQP